MSHILVARLREAPLPVSDRKAAAFVAAWLDGADADVRADFEALAGTYEGLRGFLAATFEGSPFLRDLATRDPARLFRHLSQDPDAAFDALMRRLPDDVEAHAADDGDLMRALRLAKQEAAQLIALCDLGGVWPVMTVTDRLTAFAEGATRAALRVALRREIARGRLLGLDPADPETGSGLFVLGMGKLGARELNFSSDIDLIVFYDRDVARLADPDAHQAVFVRVAQTMARLLSERTYDGVVFRVDLRLRPDPGTYPVAISTALALGYYEAVGQNWERAAMIKARPIAGDLAAGEAFLRDIRPFVWRKYLDYAAIADVHAMKRQIHAVKGHDRVKVPGHDLKLGRGGIREVEFFAQTQQLIGGGRNPALRPRATLAALDALVAARWIDARTRDDLARCYVDLRRMEHRVQIVADEQTHRLPEGAKDLAAFARFAGYPSSSAFAKAVSATLATVERHYADLFEDAPDADDSPGRLEFGGAGDDPGTRQTLKRLGFADPAAAMDIVRGWLSGRAPATRTVTARERLTECLPRLVKALSSTGQPDQGLIAFDRFIQRLPAGIQVFSLLRSNPGLLDLLADVVGTAPRMAGILGHRPRVLEGLVEQIHGPDVDPLSDLGERLASAVAEAAGLEDALDRTRVFAQEQQFLIGIRLMSGVLPPSSAGPAFSRLADVVVRDLHARVAAEHRRRFGRTPKDVSAVVALGKFGSAEMTAASDLDLLLLYDDPFDAQSDGAKPLYATEYYTRLTQRLVAALSAPTAEGTLYAVDFRLRPSGNKGPLATSLGSFTSYQETEAWTWEHMALTRARVVSGPPEFTQRIEQVIAGVLRRERDPAKLTADIVEMRRIIGKEKPAAHPWDLKLAPGGLLDVEFVAQWLVLRHAHAHPALLVRSTSGILEAAGREGLLPPCDAEAMLEAGRLFTTLTQAFRLTLDEAFDPKTAPRGLVAMVARAAGQPDLARVAAERDELSAQVRQVQKRLWGVDPHG